MSRLLLSRRRALTGLTLGAGGLLTGCDTLGENEAFRKFLFRGDDWHRALQRSLAAKDSLAPTFRLDERSPVFRVNGTANPNTAEYNAMVANQFADWRLVVDGLVANPLRLSLAQLRQMPLKTQTTLHNCVEGWSAIGTWTGPQLGLILKAAKLAPSARFIVFHCADNYRGGAWRYYESVDLIDAFHPQTILALALNGNALSVGHGAPVRLRAERHLGYKQAKFVMRVEAVASLDQVYRGKGGFWEDAAGYEWYAAL
ncbi:molybdopterin-dependent oxidoreductase [Sphingomonas sp. FW199]|uniref:molybdopterin-dependent oxidoreductase n=1 Tax=Sphingomonas sp. FW199 TaxID=3400217 RepID=UPI003CF69FD7